MSAKTKRRARERAQREREKDWANALSYTLPTTSTTTAYDWRLVSQWEAYTNAYVLAKHWGIDRFCSLDIFPAFAHVCTRGRTMRPSHLFGKCACHVCWLANFAGLSERRRHCKDCGFCMFLLCPKTFQLAWDWKATFKQRTYSCTVDASDSVSCTRRRHETRLFMLWLCWAHKRHGAAYVGLGKLPRELIRLIAKFVKVNY